MSEQRRWTIYCGDCPHGYEENQVNGPEVSEPVKVMPVEEHEATLQALREAEWSQRVNRTYYETEYERLREALAITDEMVERAARDDWERSEAAVEPQYTHILGHYEPTTWDDADPETQAQVRTAMRCILTAALNPDPCSLPMDIYVREEEEER
jgi:hypothetical protein